MTVCIDCGRVIIGPQEDNDIPVCDTLCRNRFYRKKYRRETVMNALRDGNTNQLHLTIKTVSECGFDVIIKPKFYSELLDVIKNA